MEPIQPFFQYKSRQQIEWHRFLDTYTFLNEQDYRTTIKRLDALRIFCHDGLLPFLAKYGYTWNREYNCVNHLATMLFRKWPRDFVIQEVYHPQFPTEYDFYVTEGIPQDAWDRFWNTWGGLTDFFDDAERNRRHIPSFVFNRLDLDGSDATRRYEEQLLDNEDSQEEGTLNEALVYVKDKKSMY